MQSEEPQGESAGAPAAASAAAASSATASSTSSSSPSRPPATSPADSPPLPSPSLAPSDVGGDADSDSSLLPLRFLRGEKAVFARRCERRRPIGALKQQVTPLMLAAQAAEDASAPHAANQAPAPAAASVPSAPSSSSPSSSSSSSAAAAAASTPPPRVTWIFQGQLLRDERTLDDYPSIHANSLIHVHVMDAPGGGASEGAAHAAAAVLAPDAGLRHRHAAGLVLGGQQLPGQGFVLPPPFVLGGAGGVGRGVLLAGGGGGRAGAFAAGVVVGGGGGLWDNVVFRALFALLVSLLGVLWGLALVLGDRLFSLDALLCLVFLTGVAAVGVAQAR